LTLPQARLLIESAFPEPKQQPGYVLILLKYHTRRNFVAYKSHRKRKMKELGQWKSLKKKARKKQSLKGKSNKMSL